MTPGQELTAHFVDECRAAGELDQLVVKGQMARVAKELLDIMVEDMGRSLPEALHKVKEAIGEFVRRGGGSPLKLPEISLELAQNRNPDPSRRPSGREDASEWVKLNGWPTGARFIRGSHSGTYVYDPLGTERLPMGYSDWPYKRPTFDDIVKALAKKNKDEE